MKRTVFPRIIVIGVITGGILAYLHGPGIRQRLLASPVRDEGRVANEIATRIQAAFGISAAVMEPNLIAVAFTVGNLRLEVVDRRDRNDSNKTAHFHVVAHVPNGPPHGLDACVVGVGSSSGAAVLNAAEIYVNRALPPILSLTIPNVPSKVSLFAGSERWAVPGFRGWTSRIHIEGNQVEKVSKALVDAPLYAGLSSLPADGRAHLVKVILTSRNGIWVRSLELDGQSTSISEEPWAGAPAAAGTVVVVGFAVFEKRDALEDEAARKSALVRLGAGEAWLSQGDLCTADAPPKTFVELPYWPMEACRGGRLRDCLVECERGMAASCFSAAVEIQGAGERNAPAAESLFLRACRLGFASGCTNAAATRDAARATAKSGDRWDECSRRTYEEVCDRAGDPWACTMFAATMLRGEMTPRNMARVREILGRACKYGRTHPACSAAEEMLKTLDERPEKK